jgi:hypothetical protein
MLGCVLPVVAVQISPGYEAPVASASESAARAGAARALPVLQERMLSACSAGLSRARCVSAHEVEAEAKAIAVVSWRSPEHVSIEVGLTDREAAVWVSRELDFSEADPAAERWRAVGFTIALLVDDPRFWSSVEPEPEPPPPVTAQVAEHDVSPAVDGAGGLRVELRALTGAGLVSGPWRLGAELRSSVPLVGALFVTGRASYALAQETALDMRWFDVSLGVGLASQGLLPGIAGRVRLELLTENVAATVRLGELRDARNAWVPGALAGGDLFVSLAGPWSLSAGADVFWLDGSTVIQGAGQRLATSAGAGLLLGLGAGCAF